MRRDAGLTLIELVAAMAVFAVIATMGVQSLNAAMRSRDVLVSRDIATADLSRPLALLRADLRSIVPILFYPPDRAPPRAAVLSGAGSIEFSIAGQYDLSRNGTLREGRLHRAVWRHDPDTQTLFRQQWHALAPLSSEAAGPETTVMSEVVSLSVRGHWPRTGWQPGLSLLDTGRAADASDGDGSSPFIFGDALPDAIEIILETTDYGAIRIVETLQ